MSEEGDNNSEDDYIGDDYAEDVDYIYQDSQDADVDDYEMASSLSKEDLTDGLLLFVLFSF